MSNEIYTTKGGHRRVNARVKNRVKQMKEAKRVGEHDIYAEDMVDLELLVKNAFSESNSPAEAAGKVMKVVRDNMARYMDSIMVNDAPYSVRLRIMNFKQQILLTQQP